ncbi:hypothetical protein JADG_008015 [Aureobasidium aubasidani]|nr:hypothetical protein JADG_008015 [Aureobasidium pullulans]
MFKMHSSMAFGIRFVISDVLAGVFGFFASISQLLELPASCLNFLASIALSDGHDILVQNLQKLSSTRLIWIGDISLREDVPELRASDLVAKRLFMAKVKVVLDIDVQVFALKSVVFLELGDELPLPLSPACYLWNDEQGVRAEGYACQNITFSGTVNIKQIGHAIIHLDKWNEDYLIPLPLVKVSGLITGTPYPELVGSYDIVSSSGYVASVDFSGKRLLGLAGKKNGLHAAVYSADDSSRKHPIYTLDGSWNDVFTIRDEKNNSVVEEFDTNAHPPLPVQVPDDSTLDPYESRKAWGPTISALNSGNMQAVVDEKSKVEQGQREMRKKEEADGKIWTPLFFQKVQSEPKLEKLKSAAHGDAEMDGTQGIWRWVGTEKAEQVDRPFHGDLVPWLT